MRGIRGARGIRSVWRRILAGCIFRARGRSAGPSRRIVRWLHRGERCRTYRLPAHAAHTPLDTHRRGFRRHRRLLHEGACLARCHSRSGRHRQPYEFIRLGNGRLCHRILPGAGREMIMQAFPSDRHRTCRVSRTSVWGGRRVRGRTLSRGDSQARAPEADAKLSCWQSCRFGAYARWRGCVASTTARHGRA